MEMSVGEAAEMLLLHNDNFIENHKHRFSNFLHSKKLSDVTLVCQGHFIKSHRLVLAASSPFFNDMFTLCGSNDAIVVLNNVTARHMKSILQYVYTGECQVLQDEIMTFLKVAESMHIHGLRRMNTDQSETPSSVASSSHAAAENHQEIPRIVATSSHAAAENHQEIPCIVATSSLAAAAEKDKDPNKVAKTTHEAAEDHQESTCSVATSCEDLLLENVVVKVEEPDYEDHELGLQPEQLSSPLTNFSIVTAGKQNKQRPSLRPASKRKRKLLDDFKTDGFTSDEGEEDVEDESSDTFHARASNLRSSHLPSKKRGRERNKTESKYTCNVCQKTFVQNGSLNRHYKYIHGCKSTHVQCPVCKGTYTNENALSQHANKLHPGIPVIPCKYEACDTMFFDLTQMRQHVYSMHETSDKYNCPVCDKLMKSRRYLMSHLATVHNNIKT